MASPLDHLRGLTFPRSDRKRIHERLAALEGLAWSLQRRVEQLASDVSLLVYAALPAETLAAVRHTLALLAPVSAEGVSKVRVGNADGDGGYVMLDDFARVRAAYSLGVGQDMSWDLALAERGLRVEQYDGSLKAPPARHERVRFHRAYVRASQHGRPASLTLAEALAAAGDLGRQDLLLKFDIEGDEWDLLADGGADALAAFRQIACELHGLDRLHDEHARYRRALANLTRHHAVVHLHANACWPFVGREPLRFPSLLEVTLARRADYVLVPNREAYPTAQDRANHPAHPDRPLSLAAFTPGAAS